MIDHGYPCAPRAARRRAPRAAAPRRVFVLSAHKSTCSARRPRVTQLFVARTVFVLVDDTARSTCVTLLVSGARCLLRLHGGRLALRGFRALPNFLSRALLYSDARAFHVSPCFLRGVCVLPCPRIAALRAALPIFVAGELVGVGLLGNCVCTCVAGPVLQISVGFCARLRKDLATREQADLAAKRVLLKKQFRARAAQLLQSYAVVATGQQWSYLQKLVRGMPNRLHKCKLNTYGRCGK